MRRVKEQGIFWLHGVCKSLVRGKFKTYDVIGRLGAAAKYASMHCSYDRITTLQAQMENLKANIYSYFVLEDPTVGAPGIHDGVQELEQADA